MPKRQPTKAEVFTLKRKILSTLRKKPWSGRSDVAKEIGVEPNRVSVALARMVHDGMINSTGENRGTVYRNTREAFKLLAEQYGQPIPARQESKGSRIHAPYKQSSESSESVQVSLVPAQIEINIGGQFKKIGMEEAKELYQKLKPIVGE